MTPEQSKARIAELEAALIEAGELYTKLEEASKASLARADEVIAEKKREVGKCVDRCMIANSYVNTAKAQYSDLRREVQRIPAWIRWLCGVSV